MSLVNSSSERTEVVSKELHQTVIPRVLFPENRNPQSAVSRDISDSDELVFIEGGEKETDGKPAEDVDKVKDMGTPERTLSQRNFPKNKDKDNKQKGKTVAMSYVKPKATESDGRFYRHPLLNSQGNRMMSFLWENC